MELRIAVAKVNKYAVQESGDTLEVVERPHGGISLVLADGQGSGHPAKAISNLVAKKAVSLLADGVRDGAVSRGVHDFLYAYRGGKVSADLYIISADLASRTIVISRNSPWPVLVATGKEVRVIDEPARSVGIYPRTKPAIVEVPLDAGVFVLVCTDGVVEAGRRYGERLDLPSLLLSLLESGCRASEVADSVLSRATALDKGRPDDDMSVVVLGVERQTTPDPVRRLSLTFPVRRIGS